MLRTFVRAVAPLAAAGYALYLTSVGLPADSSHNSQVSLSHAGDAAVVHLLNRIGFGPRPGDIDRVTARGVQQYIDEQLHPERLNDAAMGERLDQLTTLRLSLDDIVDQYERPVLDIREERRRNDNRPAADGSAAAPPGVGERAAAVQRRANTPVAELAQQKILRALYSERQLQEVLTDFWFNHFNVDARKGRTRFLLTAYERDAIRPHVLGRFRDLLGATAHSPAMLFYLDNWLSVDPAGIHPGPRGGRVAPGRRMVDGAVAARPNLPKGLNENYARELLELHTLGVDGGYTQKDVVDIARAFTGWTIGHPRNPRQPIGFRFDPRLHDDGRKTVLGHRIRSSGMQEGEEVLDILARHPATARFIATKIARRFVSDTPPSALVDALAARFTATDGDMREVMATLLTSQAFWATETYGAKVKTPLDFLVSAVRAVGADVADARPLVAGLRRLGMPVYQCQPPTGYKDTAEAWTNTGALVDRMNLAIDIAGRVRAPRDASVDALDTLLAHGLSESTRAVIARAEDTRQAVALTLGSPEFQRH